MGVNVIPASSGGGINSVQRGQAVSAGTITITSVNIAKSFVRSFSEGSAGTAAISGDATGTLNPSGGNIGRPFGGSNQNTGSFSSYSGTRSLSGGTTTLTTAVYGAYLSNATSLVVSGACRWEVVEFA